MLLPSLCLPRIDCFVVPVAQQLCFPPSLLSSYYEWGPCCHDVSRLCYTVQGPRWNCAAVGWWAQWMARCVLASTACQCRMCRIYTHIVCVCTHMCTRIYTCMYMPVYMHTYPITGNWYGIEDACSLAPPSTQPTRMFVLTAGVPGMMGEVSKGTGA